VIDARENEMEMETKLLCLENAEFETITKERGKNNSKMYSEYILMLKKYFSNIFKAPNCRFAKYFVKWPLSGCFRIATI